MLSQLFRSALALRVSISAGGVEARHFCSFLAETESGKVTRLFSFDPAADNRADKEVAYHGVAAVGDNIELAANEGRSFVDAVDVSTGKLLDRFAASKPCCVERIPSSNDTSTRVFISNLGDATLELAEVGRDGKLKSLGKAQVGAAPKRVAFLLYPDLRFNSF